MRKTIDITEFFETGKPESSKKKPEEKQETNSDNQQSITKN